VRINDCGPYAKAQDIDVSKRATQNARWLAAAP